MANWREMVEREMLIRGDAGRIQAAITHDNGEDVPMTDAHWDREFDDDYGTVCGQAFTMWTTTRVYFPTQYDGAEGVASVPRHPCAEVTYHI